jgi:hypothetical protein
MANDPERTARAKREREPENSQTARQIPVKQLHSYVKAGRPKPGISIFRCPSSDMYIPSIWSQSIFFRLCPESLCLSPFIHQLPPGLDLRHRNADGFIRYDWDALIVFASGQFLHLSCSSFFSLCFLCFLWGSERETAIEKFARPQLTGLAVSFHLFACFAYFCPSLQPHLSFPYSSTSLK